MGTFAEEPPKEPNTFSALNFHSSSPQAVARSPLYGNNIYIYKERERMLSAWEEGEDDF